LLSLTDGKSQTTKWNYDEYGRVTNKLDQTSTEILRYKYDPDKKVSVLDIGKLFPSRLPPPIHEID